MNAQQHARIAEQPKWRLQRLLATAGMGTYVWHVEDDALEPDARLLELLGVAEGSETKTIAALRERIHHGDRERFDAALDGALDPEGNGCFHEDLRICRPDGSEHAIALFGFAEFGGAPRHATQMLGMALDVASQQRSEANLRQIEARQAYLLKLSDALRPLADPVEIQAAATRVLGERLGVARVLYAEIDGHADDDHYVIRKDYFRPGLTSFVGRHRSADSGATLLSDLRAGLTVVVNDVANEPRLSEQERRVRMEAGLLSFVAVPIVKHGREVAFIAAFQNEAHDWSAAELLLIEETAERTWDAVERGRIEDALRISEARLAAELSDMRVLQNLSTELVQQDDPDALYEKLIDAAVAITRSDCASLQIMRPRASGGELRLLRARGFDGHVIANWDELASDPRSGCSQALRSRRRIVTPDIESHDFGDSAGLLDAYRHAGVRALQTTPLISRVGKLVGMLSTYWRQPHAPSDSELNLFDILTRQAADLIERRCSEDALRRNEERLRMIADNMAQMAWACDRLGEANWFNGRWYEFTGQTFEQARGWGWMQAHHPDHLDRVMAKVQRSRETGESWEDTHPLRRHDGEYRWFLSQALPIRDSRGAIVHWFGTHTDVTVQRQAEQALQDADRRKDEFLAMLAHELRNPLAPVRNALEILKLHETDRGRIDAAAAVLDRQVAQMSRLIDDLLDVSRITRGKIELRTRHIDINQVIADSVEAVRPLCNAREQHLTITAPANAVYVDADATRLTQVIGNLLNNACKFTECGGSIRLTVEERDSEVCVRVRDSGIGIAADQLPRVFDLFTQVDTSLERSQTGLGIGLTLVRKLVELHGGNVEAHSPGLGFGSEFVVTLPLASAPLKPLQAPPVAQPFAGNARRFLVVDDNADATFSLQTYLQLFGHDVRVAFDGVEAVAAAAESMPEIILLDVGLPLLNGFHAGRQIRNLPGGAAPIIVAVTGWGQEEDRRESSAAGFDAHLVKPVDPGALLNLIAELEKLRAAAALPPARLGGARK